MDKLFFKENVLDYLKVVWILGCTLFIFVLVIVSLFGSYYFIFIY